MFENKNNQDPYNYQNNYQDLYQNHESQDGYIDYVSDSGNSRNQKNNNGGKSFLKIIAGVAAVAIISVSSIEMYKLFGGNHSEWDAVVTSDADNPDGNSPAEESSVSGNAKNSENSGDVENSGAAVNSTANWINMSAPEGALSIPDIVEKALPSVVGINATFEYTPQNMQSYWGFGFGYGIPNYGDSSGEKRQIAGTGTGIIMTADGYIITNAHCIYDNESDYKCGKAISVSVVMGDEDETEYDAEIVGYDLETDLAVLKISANGLTPAEFGNSDELRVGETVVAIGNPLGFELFGTTTCGIVSALNREITINEKDMTLIQTDAAINQGNSGGPLLNGYGQVIGINSAKMSSSYGSAGVEGLGFAIPISDAKEIIEDLIENGYVTGRPQLGITGVNVSESDAEHFSMPLGVYVYGVTGGSAAEQAGICQGDVITAVEGTTVTNMDELNEAKNQYNAGDTITLTIFRSGQSLELELTLQEVHQEEN
ncbi:MAG: trypsin-like peptidase domain-containing protein [Oscillospiraceae bacterium]|nr:trypsin-like peptidase domain-containing protein [Oscillospiraceae bacterium]